MAEKKVGTNKELAAFIMAMIDMNKSNQNYNYDIVNIVYSDSITETQ